MEDLNRQLSSLLSDPQAMRQLQDMAAALGLGAPAQLQPEPAAPAPAEERSASEGAPFAVAVPPAVVAPPAVAAPPGQGNVSPELLQMITRLAPLLSQADREDDSTRLLQALRPMLGPVRRKKLDEAVKLLRMMRLLPLLRESGPASGLLW